MIVVDTSVWIAASRQPLLAQALRELIDEDEVALALPVRMELWAGLAKHQRASFRRQFTSIAQLYPTEDTWQAMATWIARAHEAGECFGFTDALIATLAEEIGGLVWSLDKDFERMEQHKLVSLYSHPH